MKKVGKTERPNYFPPPSPPKHRSAIITPTQLIRKKRKKKKNTKENLISRKKLTRREREKGKKESTRTKPRKSYHDDKRKIRERLSIRNRLKKYTDATEPFKKTSDEIHLFLCSCLSPFPPHHSLPISLPPEIQIHFPTHAQIKPHHPTRNSHYRFPDFCHSTPRHPS